MYNSETLYEAILANIESKYILSEDTLSMISQSNWLDNKIIQIAYDDDKNQFINDKDLHKELKSTLDILKAVKLPILKLTLKSSIRFIEYEFTDIGVIIKSKNLDTIYENYKSNLKYNPSNNFKQGHSPKHILFYNNLNTIFKTNNGKYIPLTFKFDIDFLPYQQSLILKLPEFQLAVDLKRDSELTQSHNGKNNNFTFSQVVKYKNRNDFLLTEWKTLANLKSYLNFNKFTHDEIFMFRKIKPRLTNTEFRRLINWYHQNKKDYRLHNRCDMTTLFERYINDKCNYKKSRDEFYFLIYDILNMSKRLKIKIEINATSYNGLNRYHNELVQKLRSRKAKTNKNPFKLKDKWINTHNLLQKSKLKIKHLNSVYLLDKESADMQHCVQIYDEQVKSGKSYIFHIDYYKKPYTCELVFRKNNIVINQLYGKYNQEPDPKLRQKIDKLLETLNAR
jgi:hypothetical protein